MLPHQQHSQQHNKHKHTHNKHCTPPPFIMMGDAPAAPAATTAATEKSKKAMSAAAATAAEAASSPAYEKLEQGKKLMDKALALEAAGQQVDLEPAVNMLSAALQSL